MELKIGEDEKLKKRDPYRKSFVRLGLWVYPSARPSVQDPFSQEFRVEINTRY